MLRVLQRLICRLFLFDLIYNRKHNVLREYIFAQLISFFNIYSKSFCIVNKWALHRVLFVSQLHTKGFGAPSPLGNAGSLPGSNK